ncbi:MAG TPA: MFS transporter [Gemmatimonadales bacterium]|nr:MFS transporter [Gemmatimonadales bacterium]
MTAAPEGGKTPAAGTRAADAPVRRLPTFAALRHRNFRLFFSGYVVSLVGVWMQRVAQSWLVLDLTGSAFYVGLVESIGTLPVLLFSLYAGAVADRVSRHRMVMTTQIGAMVVALAFAAVSFAGWQSITLVIILAALLGVAQAFDIPARQSFFTELVGREDLPSAIALNASAFNATRLVGPAAAGLLIGAVGVAACFLFNGVSYLAVLLALTVMRGTPGRRAVGPPASAWANIREGLRYVGSERRVRTLLLNVAAMSIFGLPTLTLLPVVARQVLGLGAQAYGWMMSAVGGGALVGALAVATFAPRIPKGRVVGLAAIVFGLSVVGVGLAGSLPAVLALLVVMGAAMITTTALTNTLLQLLAPDWLRGRVISVYTFAFVGMAPFGALLGGTVAEGFGTGAALVAGGRAATAVAALGVARSPAVRSTR